MIGMTTNCPYHIFTDVIRSRMKTQRFNHCSTKMVLEIMLLEMTIIKHGVLSTKQERSHENGLNKQRGNM